MLEPSKDLEEIFERAVLLAAHHKHEYLTLEHFLYSLLEDEKFLEVLTSYGAEITTLKEEVNNFISKVNGKCKIQNLNLI
jgi:ATP-dependent Clp protease ATP-binding subunit ClpA